MNGLIRYYSPLDRVFDRAFGPLLPATNGDAGSNGGALKLDVVETPEAYVVKAEAPYAAVAQAIVPAAVGAALLALEEIGGSVDGKVAKNVHSTLAAIGQVKA